MSSVLSAIRQHIDEMEQYIVFLEAENENLRNIIITITSDGTDKITDGINGDAERELPQR